MKKIKTLIIEDEYYAREELKFLLKDYKHIHIIGEAENIDSAVEKNENLKPDLIFLDVQLGGESGLEIFEKTQIKAKVIFATAYENYAIKAFELKAFDYLLKPVNPDRLKETLSRLFGEEKELEKPERFEYDDFILVNERKSMQFIRINTISAICSDGDYSEIHTKEDNKLLVIKSLKKWEERLPDKNFVRIHRSTIVNIEDILKIEKWFNNSYKIHMKSGNMQFEMSRRYASKIKSLFS